MDAHKLGQFIAELRKENNFTQLELARKIDVTDKAVSRWERGLGFPDINTLEPLSQALGISLLELMQSKRNENEDTISAKKAEELLLNTIQLSKTPGRFAKISGIIVLSVFAIIAVIVLGVLFTDWDKVNYIVLSIIFGLIALGVPVWGMLISQKAHIIVPSAISLSCAGVAVIFQIINIAYDIHINDTAAIIDTIDVVVMSAGIFSAVTILLNIIMIVYSKKKYL